MRLGFMITSVSLATILCAASASTHFGMVIPSDSMVMHEDNRSVTLHL